MWIMEVDDEGCANMAGKAVSVIGIFFLLLFLISQWEAILIIIVGLILLLIFFRISNMSKEVFYKIRSFYWGITTKMSRWTRTRVNFIYSLILLLFLTLGIAIVVAIQFNYR
jgi:hypothetical protein